MSIHLYKFIFKNGMLTATHDKTAYILNADCKEIYRTMKEYYENEPNPICGRCYPTHPKANFDYMCEECTTELKEFKSKLYAETTPNCGMCEWQIERVDEGHNKHKIKQVCTAQGFKLCAVCYNTTECKKLFQEEIDD